MTDVLLTVRTTAGVSGDQCLRERDLLNELIARLYDYIGDADDPLLIRAEGSAGEWDRLGRLCKERESEQQVPL